MTHSSIFKFQTPMSFYSTTSQAKRQLTKHVQYILSHTWYMPQTVESFHHSFKYKMCYTQTIKDSWEVTLHWWVSGFGCFETSGITHPATQLPIPESLNPQQHLARRTVLCLKMSNKSTIDCQDKHCVVSPTCSAS